MVGLRVKHPLSEGCSNFMLLSKPTGESITKIELALNSCFMRPYFNNAITLGLFTLRVIQLQKH
jgi:hypothetical protein